MSLAYTHVATATMMEYWCFQIVWDMLNIQEVSWCEMHTSPITIIMPALMYAHCLHRFMSALTSLVLYVPHLEISYPKQWSFVTAGTWGWLSEAPEMHMEGGWVNHCWCIVVVSHGYGGLGEGREGGGGWLVLGQNLEGVVACWQMPEHFPRLIGMYVFKFSFYFWVIFTFDIEWSARNKWYDAN